MVSPCFQGKWCIVCHLVRSVLLWRIQGAEMIPKRITGECPQQNLRLWSTLDRKLGASSSTKVTPSLIKLYVANSLCLCVRWYANSCQQQLAPASAFGIKLHPLRMNFDEDIQDTLRPSEKQRRKNFPLATNIYKIQETFETCQRLELQVCNLPAIQTIQIHQTYQTLPHASSWATCKTSCFIKRDMLRSMQNSLPTIQ